MATMTVEPLHIPTATIYIRNYAKKAIMLNLPARVRLLELKDKIYHRMRVPQEDQVLFLHGEMVEHDNDEVQLQNKFIFHLVNKRRTRLQSLTLSIKRIQPNSPSHQITVAPQMKIGDFMLTHFQRFFGEADNYFLVYTGRELQLDKTFQLELVEHESELLAIHKVENLKAEIPQQSSERNIVQERPSIFMKKQNQQNYPSKPPTATIDKPKQNEVIIKREQEEEVNRSAEGQGNNRKSEEAQVSQDNSETEDIVINYQPSYSVINKNNMGPENPKRTKNKSSSQSGYSQKDAQEEKQQEQGDYEQGHESLGVQDRLAPLGLTVISSRHDEQSLSYDQVFKSSQKQQKNGMHISGIQDGVSEIQESNQQADNQKEEMQAHHSLDIQGKQGAESYGKTNILEYMDEDNFLEKEEDNLLAMDEGPAYANRKPLKSTNNQQIILAVSKQRETVEHYNQEFQKGDTSQGEQEISHSKKKSNESKSAHSESMLLETSQDVNQDNTFSGRFVWGSLKNDKNDIDISAQLQEEANFNEIVPGTNANNWQQLSFSFRNSQTIQLVAGDLIMLAHEQGLRISGLQSWIAQEFVREVRQPEEESLL